MTKGVGLNILRCIILLYSGNFQGVQFLWIYSKLYNLTQDRYHEEARARGGANRASAALITLALALRSLHWAARARKRSIHTCIDQFPRSVCRIPRDECFYTAYKAGDWSRTVF